MCGFVGLAGPQEPVWLDRMSARLAHRGPDDAGSFRDAAGMVGLAFRRLSILDVAHGHQPMSAADGQLWIVYNGEIYNAPELRAELEARGYRFATDHSDTEVLLALYAERGEAMLDALNGMFAFVIYDRRRRRLFGARDRFGIKPFYYAQAGGVLAAASELKALLAVPVLPRELEPQSVYHYMSLKYLPGEATIFRGMQRLPPGHQLTYDLERRTLTVRPYWMLRFEPELGLDLRAWSGRIRDGLERAVRRWTLSDVPIGCSLSGGVDSSALVGLLARQGGRVRTYSLGFAEAAGEPLNELALAREVAQRWGTEHHELILTADELLEDLVRMVWALDEPYGGGLPSWYVFRFMRRDVKVAMTGTGGDELFGNYGKFRWLEANPMLRFARLEAPALARRLLGRREPAWAAAALGEERDTFRRYYFNRFYYLSDAAKRAQVFAGWAGQAEDSGSWLRQRYERIQAPTVRDRVASLDISTQLAEEFLLMTDRFSMAHGLEARVPYLDHELAELIFRIPAKRRTRPAALKYLFKRSVQDLLPEPLQRAPKRGFILPTAAWLRGRLRPLVERLLSPERLQRQGIFQPAFHETFVRPHLSGAADYADQVWTALMFQLWHVVFIEQGGAQPTYGWREVAAG